MCHKYFAKKRGKIKEERNRLQTFEKFSFSFTSVYGVTLFNFARFYDTLC